MATRTPLAEIPANRARGAEVSDYQKIALVARCDAGETHRQIVEAESLPKSTVSTILKKVAVRGTVKNTYRSGQPRKTTKQDERKIIREARRNPKWTYSELVDSTGLTIYYDTFRNILHG